MSTLWRVIDVSRNANNSFLNQIYAWESDNYTEFSKMVQDKVVGTQLEAAHVYDLNTGMQRMFLTWGVAMDLVKAVCRLAFPHVTSVSSISQGAVR